MKQHFRETIFVIALLLLTMTNSVFAECWVIGGLKGYAGNAADNFDIHKDGLSGQQFRININGEDSWVTGWEGVTFVEITPQLIIGIYKSGYKGQVDSWGIDIDKRKVFYTQTKSGYSIFDGAKMFIGELVGKCK